MTKKTLLMLSFFLGIGLASLLGSHASAASFNKNDLIDDPVFTNQTMSAGQINAFLNAQPSSCISTNSGFYTPDPTGWSSTVQTNHGYTFSGNVSAGQAIYDAAHIYNVNPQVILATMQKEQSVVTGGAGCHYTNPSPGNACTFSGGGCVFIAMSYGCPGGCSVDYSTTDGSGFDGIGNAFSLQLIAATWLLRWSEERSQGVLTGYTGFDPGDNNIYYGGPMTAGTWQRSASTPATYFDGTDTLNDSTSVTIGSGGTAALYYFTPFISGNTHFDSIFNTWFGTQFSVYGWQPVSQEVYTDSSEHTALGGSASLLPGETAYVVVIAANTGDTTWTNSGSNPTELGTADPGDRASAFCTNATGWLGCPSRPALLSEASVPPGDWGTFKFPITAPGGAGTYYEHFNLVTEGITWFNDAGLDIPLTVLPLNYSWQIVNESMFADAGRTNLINGTAWMVSGQTAYAQLIVANTSNYTWTQTGPQAVMMGTSGPNDRASPFCTSQWLACNRPALLQQTTVAPGQWGSFVFPVTAPDLAGSYIERFNLVGNSWFKDQGQSYQINVIPRAVTWQVSSQGIYTDSSLSTLLGTSGASLSTNQTAYAVVSARNNGNFTWTNTGANPIDIGTDQPTDRTSAIYNAGWFGNPSRPARLLQSSVAPGQVGTFEFPITAPSSAGTYNEHFNLVAEGLTWFVDPGQSFQIVAH